MKRLFQLTFFTLLLLCLGFFVWQWLLPLLRPSTGQLSVTTPIQKATVKLDQKELGKTPLYLTNLRTGDHTIKIETDGASFEIQTTLTANTFNSLDLNVSRSSQFTWGENLYFRTGQRNLTILSKPQGAKVFLNNQDKGKTPLKIDTDKGVVSITLKKDGYLSREITPNIVDNFRTTVNAFLSVDPFGTIQKLDGNSKITLFSLHNNSVDLSKSYSDWAEGVAFTQKQLTNSGTRFDVLIDPNGKVYILDEAEWKNKQAAKAVSNAGYLSTKANDTLSEKASQGWQQLKAQFN